VEGAASMKRHVGAFAVVLSLSTRDAWPCDAANAGRPVRVPTGPGDLGTLPEACEATDAALVTRAAALVATDDLYGNLQAAAGVRGRLVVAERTWVSLWAPELEYRFVANATVESDRGSLGATLVGAHHRIPISERASIAPFARVLLPTETSFERATRWGGDHGIAARARLADRLELIGGGTFALTTTVNGSRYRSLLTESFTTDVVYRPRHVIAIAAGVGVRLALRDERPFESLDPRLGVRLFPWRALFVILDAVTPIAGRDRTDLALALSAGWTFDAR
jgi:hypothetical protein